MIVGMHIEVLGTGPHLVLLHGSVTPGWATWNAQRPLADRFTLVVPVRSGYPPNPPLGTIDFDVQAEELAEVVEPGDHLVGHSYGGIVAMLAAPGLPLGSLTVLEPLLGAAPFPKLVVSGGHSAAFDAVCDVLELRLDARRAVLPGAGHSIPRVGEPLNALIAAFVTRS